MTIRRFLTLLTILLLISTWIGCGDSSLTGSTEVTDDLRLQDTTSNGSLVINGINGNDGQEPTTPVGAPFDCGSVGEVSVRFGDPGYIRNNRVALYASFKGTPAGDKELKIWWDYRNQPETIQTVDLDEGIPQDGLDPLFDVETVVEHEYADLDGPEEFVVRAELVREGEGRGCARNRTITVAPPPSRRGGSLQLAGTAPPNPAFQSFAPIDITTIEGLEITLTVRAKGNADAKAQIGLQEKGSCCAWQSPIVTFTADGSSRSFIFTPKIGFDPDGIGVGFSGITTAEWQVDIRYQEK